MGYARLGLPLEAQRCLERHLEHGLVTPELWGQVAMAWARKGDLRRAQGVMEQMLAHDLLPSDSVVAQMVSFAAKSGDGKMVATCSES